MKILTPDEAVALVKDGDFLVTEGFNLGVHANELTKALGARFEKDGSPKALTLMYCAGNGEPDQTVCVSHIAKEGLLKRVIAGHWALSPALGALCNQNKIEAYNIPQGTIAHMYRDSAGKKVGTFTNVGLGTFADPRQEGCKMNSVTKEPINKIMNIEGEELLFYKRLDFNVCFLRGTYADEKGNISMEKECLHLDNMAVAQAVKRNGGTVIVQVGSIVKAGSLNPHLVKIPAGLVDVVVPVGEALNMWESPRGETDIYNGRVRVPVSIGSTGGKIDERKIIGRRGALELTKGAFVNLGVGMPEQVALVAGDEGFFDQITLTVEAGALGGLPRPRPLFGCATNVECITTQSSQFDFYDGGGLDLAFLGLAQTDPKGNINVSKMGDKLPGAGGFINIAQNARKVFFCGTFVGKGLKISAKDNKLSIDQEGSMKKFVNKVDQITYNGEMAAARGQFVMFLTERCAFKLTKAGLELVEVAEGINIEKDILPHMEFKPIINKNLKIMDSRIFKDALMGLGK